MAKTTDELFAEATEADYETAEPVTLAASDTEEEFQFRIDEHLRTIAIPEKGVVAGVEGDLNVNIARFTMTRYYHGRDLSKLNIRINYRNANGQVNYYTVSDATASGDSIIFSWEFAADVTQYKGNVQFVVYLFSATNAVLKQRFFTTLGTLEVLEGLEVDSSIPVSEQTDILLHLKKDLSAYAEEVKKSLPADYTAMTEQVSSLKEDLVNFDNKYTFENLMNPSRYKERKEIYAYDLDNGTVTYGDNYNIVSTELYEVKRGERLYFRLGQSSLCFIFLWDKDTGVLEHKCVPSINGVVSSDGNWVEADYTMEKDYYMAISQHMRDGSYITTSMFGKSVLPDEFSPYGKKYIYNTNLNDKLSSISNDLYGKRVAYFGDSLMYGLELQGNGYVDDIIGGIWKRLNEKYNLTMTANLSEGGACLQKVGSDTKSICYKMANFDASDTDIVIFDGGVNDHYALTHLSGYSIGTVNENWSGYLTSDDYSTIVNSVETAIRHLIRSNQNIRIFWIKAWRNASVDDTMIRLYDEIEKVCHKYGVAVCDLFNNCGFALMDSSMKNKFGRHNYTSETTFDYDGTHINTDAYDRITPIIGKFISQNL